MSPIFLPSPTVEDFNKISEGFGSRFKEILKKHGISQSRFGDDTETHKGLISRYINGESPSGDFIMKAVSYFPEEVQFLFFGESESRVEESSSTYRKSPDVIINEIESKLQDLKRALPQK